MINCVKKIGASGAVLFLFLMSAEHTLAQTLVGSAPTSPAPAKTTSPAEVKNPALFKAVYEFIHVDDSTQRERPRQEDMFLYVNSTSSLYRRSTEEESEYYRYLQSGGSKESFDINGILDKTASLFQNIPGNQSVSTERIISEMYQITEPLPEIVWEIGDEIREISGYRTQRATGHFRGRDYEVWFAADIPFSFGPWKLHGLPGLILEARDSRDDVIFTLKSFGQPEGQPVDIVAPGGIRKVSAAEYVRVYKAFRDNPMAFARATAAPGMTVVAGRSPTTVAGGSVREKVYNNPLELTLK